MRILVAVIVVMFSLDCANLMAQPPSQHAFPYAFARRGCTQEDAPAIEIYLTRVRYAGGGEPATPFIRIEIASGDLARVVDTTISLVPLSRHGIDRNQRIARAELNQSKSRTVWLKGSLRLARVEPGKGVDGRYDIVDPSGRVWRGEVRANWRESSSPGCG